MAYLTLVASSTNTTKPLVLPKDTPCLHSTTAYSIAEETTYIIVYDGDTFIFRNSEANIEAVITNTGKHKEVTLDHDATRFLGLNLAHNTDGTVTITQPKLLIKLFFLYPPRKDSAHITSHPYPPLPKETDPTPQLTDYSESFCTSQRAARI